MRRVLIVGNSASGKTTLAKSLSESDVLRHLDLDSIAWLDTDPPKRTSIAACEKQIAHFMSEHDRWVIEGCYADLLEIAARNATEMVFLNLSVELCVNNALSRPWEPHKYRSQDEQDANLEMLVDWIRDYPNRRDACSLRAHQMLFESFPGPKRMETSNKH